MPLAWTVYAQSCVKDHLFPLSENRWEASSSDIASESTRTFFVRRGSKVSRTSCCYSFDIKSEWLLRIRPCCVAMAARVLGHG